MQGESKLSTYRNVLLLGFTSLLNDVSSEMVLPVLPLLIERLGGTGVVIGIIGGLRESFADLLKALFGYWSDKVGNRKAFVYTGYLTTAVFKFFLYLSTAWYQVLVFIGLERIGKGLRTAPRDAIIVQSMPGKVGLGFGIHRACDTLGALIGSGLAAYLVWRWHIEISTIIFVAFVIAAFAVIPLYWVTEEQPAVPPPSDMPQPMVEQPRVLIFTPQLLMFIGIAMLFSLANISYMFCMLHASELFKNSYAVAMPMALYALFNTTYTISAIPSGMLSDTVGHWKMIVIGYGLFALTMFSFAFFSSLAGLAFCFMMYGFALAIVKVTNKAYVADLSLPSFRSTALGSFEAATGIATIVAGILIGLMWEHVGHVMVFTYAGVVSLMAMLLMMGVRQRMGR